MSSGLLKGGLVLAGMLLLAAFAWQLAADVLNVASREPELPLAERIAQADLAKLPADQAVPEAVRVASESGWFPAIRQPIFSWEEGLDGWKLETAQTTTLGTSGGTEDEGVAPGGPVEASVVSDLKQSTAQARHGNASLQVPVSFPDPVTVFCPARHLRGVRFIAYDVFLPAEARGYVGCLFFLKDKDGRWFQARSRAALQPGKWTTVTADIRGGSPDVEPLGHTGQWDENQASQVLLAGLTFYGDQPFKGSLFVDNFRGWMRAERFVLETRPDRMAGLTDERRRELTPFVEVAQKETRDPLKFLNLRTEPAAAWTETGALPQVKTFDSFIVRFDLNREVRNPFDPAQADLQAEVVTPSNKTVKVCGYWYQDFERSVRFAAEELVPVGRPEWRVRFTPREPGLHRLRLSASLDGGREIAQGPEMRFEAVASGRRGFLRVSKENPYFFEFENGEFFYPIGHNIHTPVDVRCWSRIFQAEPPIPRGLTMYEELFPKMAAHGENVGEVWMASWWVAIEWTSRWPHYHGAGRYSLERAWLLDRLFDLARANGLQIHLVIDNHGKISNWCDEEWAWNPYNRSSDSSGWLSDPDEFFTDPRSRELHNRRLRYIASRWSGDPTILGWEIISEYDLVGGRNNGEQLHRGGTGHQWARDTARWLRSNDPYGHPITNHYSGNYAKVDMELMRTADFDYIVGDGYRGDGLFTNLAVTTADHFQNQVRKPFWLTEYGGNWSATTEPRLHADLHAGMWSTWLTHGAGTPLFWWYDVIDRRNFFGHFQGFANFIQGEDRRKIRGQTAWLQPGGSAGGLQGLEYRWDRGAYVWIYDRDALLEWPDDNRTAAHRDVKVTVADLAPGAYRIEFWDTLTGQIVGSQSRELKTQESMSIDLPPFLIDLALKVKALSGETGGGYPQAPIAPPPINRGDPPPAPPGPGPRR